VPNGRFGWAHGDPDDPAIQRHHSRTEIVDLVDAVAEDLVAGQAVALCFECPLFVPVPEQALRLGTARPGEKNRLWSAGVGAGAIATGLVEIAWILDQLRAPPPGRSDGLSRLARFTAAGSGLNAL
jgi:hypothetical protein